ncbi:MAG: FecR domain-containing protein [Verrucomicrobiales bacterium]
MKELEMGDRLRQHLEELLSKACEERLTEAESSDLDSLLAVCGEARRYYRRYMNLHATLHSYLAEVAPGDARKRPQPNIPPAKVTPIRAQPRPRVNPAVLAIAAAVVFGVGFFAVEWLYEHLPAAGAGGRGGGGVVLATLTESFDARWAPGSMIPDDGAALGREMLSLVAGAVRIKFDSGVDAVFEGRSEIEILSTNSARLHSGQLVAKVPAAASGFTVETLGFDVVDLGTVFGVRVRENGEVELSVLEGRVELVVRDEGNEGAGAAVAIRQVRKGQAVLANPGDFAVRKTEFKPGAFRKLLSLD